jgi:hypothetical protein
MARREWALKIVGKQVFHDRRCGPIVNFPRAVKLVTVEHARAVRIVKRIGTKKCPDWLPMNHYDDGYIMACEHILAALTKGRA